MATHLLFICHAVLLMASGWVDGVLIDTIKGNKHLFPKQNDAFFGPLFDFLERKWNVSKNLFGFFLCTPKSTFVFHFQMEIDSQFLNYFSLSVLNFFEFCQHVLFFRSKLFFWAGFGVFFPLGSAGQSQNEEMFLLPMKLSPPPSPAQPPDHRPSTP